MSRPPERPLLAALVVALLCAGAILAAQLLTTFVPAIGEPIRRLPLLPIALVVATVALLAQLIRSR